MSGSSRLKNPENLLILMSFAMALSFAVWQTLLNNFVIERAAFTGEEIGLLQSLREVPGFLAFTAVFVLLLLREQTFALLSILVMGLGVAMTGFFPTIIGLYLTTVLMSIGFHYFEALQQSLAMQWFPKETAASSFGRLLSAKSAAAIIAYLGVWAATIVFTMDYTWIYLVAGLATVFIAIFASVAFPTFEQPHTQHKKIILRKRYWLYYALTFMSGARRQIFVVFAGFLMVEKFGYSVASIAMLFLVNHLLTMFLAPKIGHLISYIGERSALILEYIGLIIIFVAYAFVEDATIAAGLYIVDHVFFALAIAIKTYFQKIVDPQDISASAAVSFSINHTAAVVIPAVFGLIWLQSSALVFLLGALMAFISLLLSFNVPGNPSRELSALRGNVLPAN